MHRHSCLFPLLLLLAGAAAPLHAQTLNDIAPGGAWNGTRSWSVFAQYSPTSTHLVLGIVDQRTFIALGGEFNQRLAANRVDQFFWAPEIRPLMVESDPAQTGFQYNLCALVTLGQPCTPASGYYRFPEKRPVINTGVQTSDQSAVIAGLPYYQNYTFHYGRRWTYVSGVSPLAFRWVFRPQAPVQPLLGVSAGVAFATRDIPMFETSAFNFTFGCSAGFQVWRNRAHATRVEYRFQHLSNAGMGPFDPGIDSQMVQVSYVWGWR